MGKSTKQIIKESGYGPENTKEVLRALERRMTTLEGNPIAYVKPGHEPSIFAPRPMVDFDAMKMELNLPKSLAKVIRKVMQAEQKSRGKALDEAGKLMRGTWWHGRKTMPEVYPAERLPAIPKVRHYGKKEIRFPDMRAVQKQQMHLGEPNGISLSARPNISKRFDKSGKGMLGRMMPMYRGRPEDMLLDLANPEHQKIIGDTYVDTAVNMIKKRGIDFGPGGVTPQKVKEFLNISPDRFNQLYTQAFQDKGYKGWLYHPYRGAHYQASGVGGEAELKLFDPQDVMMLDKRKYSAYDDLKGKEVVPSRYDLGKEAQYERNVRRTTDMNTIDERKTGSLRTLYQEQKVTERIAKELGWKGEVGEEIAEEIKSPEEALQNLIVTVAHPKTLYEKTEKVKNAWFDKMLAPGYLPSKAEITLGHAILDYDNSLEAAANISDMVASANKPISNQLMYSQSKASSMVDSTKGKLIEAYNDWILESAKAAKVKTPAVPGDLKDKVFGLGSMSSEELLINTSFNMDIYKKLEKVNTPEAKLLGEKLAKLEALAKSTKKFKDNMLTKPILQNNSTAKIIFKNKQQEYADAQGDLLGVLDDIWHK